MLLSLSFSAQYLSTFAMFSNFNKFVLQVKMTKMEGIFFFKNSTSLCFQVKMTKMEADFR